MVLWVTSRSRPSGGSSHSSETALATSISATGGRSWDGRNIEVGLLKPLLARQPLDDRPRGYGCGPNAKQSLAPYVCGIAVVSIELMRLAVSMRERIRQNLANHELGSNSCLGVPR